jgi:glycosyltransferase involved in cell wall biosynthesis
MPLSFAVVTPSFNQATFIERTVRSVLEQHYTPLEYVICDGQSTDATLDVLELYRGQLTIISEPDSGQAAAVNKGIQRTRGEIIGWLNSDDVYRPEALSRVASFFDAAPDVDVVYGDADLIDEQDRFLDRYYTEAWSASRLADRCILAQPAVFLRRRVVEQWGGLDERLQYVLDYEYWLRLARAGACFRYVPGVLAATRLHASTKTQGSRRAVHDEMNRMLRAHLGRVPESWLLNTAHTSVELARANGRSSPLPYAAEVVARALVLSYQWNGSISRHMLAITLLPLVHAAQRRLLSSRGRSGLYRGSKTGDTDP